MSAVTLRVRRHDPESGRAPHWQEYTLDAAGSGTVLSLLNRIRSEVDSTLVFRRSCEQGACGSDAMVINGRNGLACRTLVSGLGRRIDVAPLPGLPVIRDLVVDMGPFFASYRSVSPYLIDDGRPPGDGERRQSPEAKERFDNSTGCILCAACTTSCPVFQRRDEYLGPAALVAAHRFIYDDRDTGDAARRAVVAELDGAMGCRTALTCTDVCPRGVEVSRAVAEVKQWVANPRVADRRPTSGDAT